MSTIIECPACETRYKMNKPIPEGGRSVKCARCGHQWRLTPEEPEELTEAVDFAADPTQGPAPAAPAHHPEPVPPAAQTAFAQAAFTQPPTPSRYEPPAAGYEPATGAGYEPPTAAGYEPPTAAGYEPPTAAGYEPPSGAGYEPPPAAPPDEVSSWAVRRGNLAAAIASMGESTGARHEESEPHAAASAEPPTSWDAEAGYPPRDRRMDQTVGEAFFGMTPPAEPEYEAPQPAAPFGTDRPIWETDPSWMRGEDADAPQAAEIDPEMSVREALRAALEDQDPGLDAETEEARAAGPSLGRPVFGDPALQDDPADDGDDHPRGMATPAAAALAEPARTSAETLAPADLAASKKEFSTRWRSFTSGRNAPPAEAGDPGPDPAPGQSGDDEDTERFESDIAGIFRQEPAAKRSFGPPASGRRPEGSFTDYDMESGSGTDAADDRYMADSPLDADAAALQAALEGSLRERHNEETRTGGGLALAAAWAVFISVLSGVTLAFVSFRDEIVVALPGMAPLYRGIGLGVQDQQIDFGPVHYRWIEADGKPVIQVTGQIINLTDREIPVPRMLINIRDRESGDTIKATETLRSEPLAARETTDFTLEFMSPSKTISQIELAFAKAE